MAAKDILRNIIGDVAFKAIEIPEHASEEFLARDSYFGNRISRKRRTLAILRNKKLVLTEI